MKNHVANPKPVRVTASVWGSLLQTYIQTHRQSIEIRHPNGDLALPVTSQEASLLTMRGMVAGYVHRDCLRYLITRAPVSRIRAILSCDAPRSSHDVSIKRTFGLGWATRFDQAKLGHCGGRSSVTHTPPEVQMSCLGGDCTRRVVTR